jgi:chromosome segregation protein
LEARRAELGRDLAEAERELGTALVERDRLRGELAALEGRAGTLRRRIEEAEGALKLRRRELEAVRQTRAGEEVELVREQSQLEHLVEGFLQTHGLKLQDAAASLASSELARERDALQSELAEIREKIDSLGPVNLVAIEQFQELETRFDFLSRQRKDLLESIASTGQAIQRIDTTSRQRFQEAFREIDRHFDATFKQLFGGGRAGLSLIDQADPLESGIDISAQPPGKRLQNVLLLSGGEKALTAISLMFAIFRYKPSPFCLLDEVDAPLDDANLGRFLTMLSSLVDSTQFIIITHNRKTMEMADQMYGVTMEEPGISKLVSVKLVEATRLAEMAVAR